MKTQLIDYYSSEERMYVAIDCIIFGYDGENIKLLIFKRKVDPFKGAWSLIGSFVKLDEDVDSAARRVLKEITGLKNIFMKQLKTYGNPYRDPGYRCITIGYYALIRINDQNKELVKTHGAVWYNVEDLPDLVLDHNTIVKDALKQLRFKASHQPIGFNLLPEKFTIPGLQRLYEEIYQKQFDSRNFRKKIMSFDVLKKLNEKDKISSKKGAFLYKFDKERYYKLLASGISFEILAHKI